VLKILHTADWHLGYVSQQLDDEDAKKLAQARLAAVERIFGIASGTEVRCILCAGDLFDVHDPPEEWWQGLLDVFHRRHGWATPVILLPGNHDPIRLGSVYSAEHPFRRNLPEWAHVVDQKGFSFELGDEAVILAAPCESTAGDTDLALTLPNRAEGDDRIRIGLVHGTTFDLSGYEVNFPISKEAAELRGLDYLAVGDTHGYRDVVPGSRAPTVYPGTPEPTRFGEEGAGSVVIVGFRSGGRRPRLIPQTVARWRWEERTVRSIPELDALLDEDLGQTVLKLRLELEVTIAEQEHVDHQLRRLKGSFAAHGRAGAMITDTKGLRLNLVDAGLPDDLPELILEAGEQLTQASEEDPIARRALILLHRLVQELR
jgi:DNA repair exonuclease SbcCD nuclease subunit